MSELWNHEARCELREQRKCVAVIKGDRPCASAKKLNDIFGSGSLNALPFSGLDVSIIRSHDCVDEVSPSKAEEIYGNLLKMPLKYLKFWWWGKAEDCVLAQLIMKLMARSLTLEQLEIADISRKDGFRQKEGEQEEKEQYQLPNLSTLQIYDTEIMGAADELFWGNVLRTICNRAPNLQVLKNTVSLHWIDYMPTESLRIFKNIKLPSLWPRNEEMLTLMNKFSKHGPKLFRLETDCPEISTRGWRMDNNWTLLFDILSRSCGSLQEVILDGRTVFMLKQFAQRKKALANVTSLEFQMPGNEQSTITRYLLPVPLGEIFPAVTAVTINWGYYEESSWAKDVEVGSCEIFSWDVVTEVELEDFELQDPSVRELATLFPNLRSLCLCDSNNFTKGDAFRHIWRWLPSLEKLDMSIALEIDLFPNSNFDAEFCGLYEEEAAYLREKDDTYLKTVNIVPPFPPINYMRGKT